MNVTFARTQGMGRLIAVQIASMSPSAPLQPFGSFFSNSIGRPGGNHGKTPEPFTRVTSPAHEAPLLRRALRLPKPLLLQHDLVPIHERRGNRGQFLTPSSSGGNALQVVAKPRSERWGALSRAINYRPLNRSCSLKAGVSCLRNFGGFALRFNPSPTRECNESPSIFFQRSGADAP